MGPLIEISDLHKSFGTQHVLKGISFSIKKGEIVAVIGPSGSGKSTLIRCINGLESFHSGDVLIEGESIKQNRNACRKTGMVFQDFNLFPHHSVLHNISNPCRVVKNMDKSKADELALSLLKKVRLSDKANSYPKSLSGGQQQRVAIARALAMNPAIMLFDEPTSALDPELAYEVFEAIEDLAHDGLTMIIVTHQVNLVKEFANRIVFMDHGQIRADGTTEEIISSTDLRLKRFLKRITVA